jgi:hypothetical protein
MSHWHWVLLHFLTIWISLFCLVSCAGELQVRSFSHCTPYSDESLRLPRGCFFCFYCDPGSESPDRLLPTAPGLHKEMKAREQGMGHGLH